MLPYVLSYHLWANKYIYTQVRDILSFFSPRLSKVLYSQGLFYTFFNVKHVHATNKQQF